MKFEELISKYLDSELSPKEDSELRRIISEDPVKKQEFEEYIELSYLLKKDADIDLLDPYDKDEVEDNLLMHIVKEQSKIKNRKVIYKNIMTPVLSIFLVFFISVYTIFDYNLYNPYSKSKPMSYNISIPDLELKDVANQVIVNNNININDNNIATENNREVIIPESKSDVIESSIFIKNEENISSDYKKDINKSNETTNFEEFDNYNSETEKISTPNTSYLSSEETDYNKLRMNYEQNDLKLNDLSFESNLFTDIVRTGFNPTNSGLMNTFAQSVSIKLNSKSKIGVELGVSEYDFNVTRKVTIPYSELDEFNGSLDGSRRLPNGLLTSVNTTITYNNYFANVFFDSKIYENKNFDFIGRVGLGVSNGGFLVSSRLYFDVPVYGALHLITGIDTRAFQNSNLFYNQNDALNSNVSFVNGFYFRF